MAIIKQVLEYSQSTVRNGTIEGVKIVGLNSRHGYRYLTVALSQAIPLYEDAPVYILHPDDREKRRGSRQTDAHIGSLKGVRLADDGLFGDLHVRQSHVMAGTILSSAKTQGGGKRDFGLSHNVVVKMNDAETEITEIVTVNSVDLVDNPATNQNLYEGEEDMPELAEMVAAQAASDKKIAELVEGQANLLTAIEGLAEKKESEAKKRATALERIAVTEGGENETPTGNTHLDFTEALRGFPIHN